MIYRKRLPLKPGICRLYPEMKVFSNIRPAALVHSSNSGEMKIFLFDFSPKCCHFRINPRYGPDLQAE